MASAAAARAPVGAGSPRDTVGAEEREIDDCIVVLGEADANIGAAVQPYTGADSLQERLKAAADLWVARITTRKTGSANAEVTPDMMGRLKSLGYVQ